MVTTWGKMGVSCDNLPLLFHNVFYATCIIKSLNSHISVVVCSFFLFRSRNSVLGIGLFKNEQKEKLRNRAELDFILLKTAIKDETLRLHRMTARNSCNDRSSHLQPLVSFAKTELRSASTTAQSDSTVISSQKFNCTHLTLSQKSLVFTCLKYKSFETMWEKEKLLIMRNFSFSLRNFYQFDELSVIFIKFGIVICKLFQLGRV